MGQIPNVLLLIISTKSGKIGRGLGRIVSDMCICAVVLTRLSSSLAAEKNHVLCLLLKWTILKGKTLLEVVSSAALITLWKTMNVWVNFD